ncbi:CHRD domain-containing protein [Sphingomonas sp. Tas61C01]|uniref:CHRD domain-containing protein n=1 Tax=Sphingomonas sp. Tas61C01 TaxID=3458297 RepID=UPI00403E4671
MQMTSIRRASATLAMAGLSLGLTTPAAAVTTFSTTMQGINENPPVASAGLGLGQLVLSDDMNSFSVTITYSGLSSTAVAGHVHCCAPIGSNASVAIGFTVPGGVAGTIMGTYNLLDMSIYNGAFLTASGGTGAGARMAFITGLNGGLAYLNIHTAVNPGGEIRGQLGVVPEPATWAMMILGFGLMGAAIRYRRKSSRVSFA